MNPLLSRRMANAMMVTRIPLNLRMKFARQVESAASFEDLSIEAQNFIAEAESVSLLKEWDESQVERDELGRFTGAGGYYQPTALNSDYKFVPSLPNDKTTPGISAKSVEVASRIGQTHYEQLVRWDEKWDKPADQNVYEQKAIYTNEDGTRRYELTNRIDDEIKDSGRRVTVYVEAKRIADDIVDPTVVQTGRFHRSDGYLDGSMMIGSNRESNESRLAIDSVDVRDSEQRQGLATAMLEFARRESPLPIVHSQILTDEGKEFSRVVKEWDESKVERDENGRFTDSGFAVASGSLATEASEGFSVNPLTGARPTTGFMVARPQYGAIVDTTSKEDAKDKIREYLRSNADVLSAEPDLYLGGWRNTEDGKLYLDIVDNVRDKETATDLGGKRDQIAIWDVAGSDEVATGGTGGANAQEGFGKHPDEIYGVGTVVRKAVEAGERNDGRGVGRSGSGTYGRFVQVSKEWDESQVERDERGRFAPVDAQEAINEARHDGHLTEILRQTYGNIMTVGFGNRNLNLEKLKEMTRALVVVRDAYPQATVNRIEVRTMPSHEFGRTETMVNRTTGEITSQFIVINSKMVNNNDSDRLDEEIRAKGDHAGGTVSAIESTIIHEYGHALDYSRPEGTRDPISIYDTARGLSESLGMSPEDIIKTQTSAYAGRNARETVAEAFVDVVTMGNDASPLSKALTEKLLGAS